MEPRFKVPISHGELHAINIKQHFRKSSLKNEATIKRTRVTPVKMFAINTDPTNLTQERALKFVPSESQMPTNGRYVSRNRKTENQKMNPKQRSFVKRSVNQAPSRDHPATRRNRRSNRSVRSRRRVSQRRRRRVTPTIRTRRKRSTTSSTSAIIRPTTDTTQNGSEVVVKNKFHPCNNEANSSAMEYRVENIECRRWRKTDLQQMMNCLGTFNHQYLATTLQEALNNFTDLDTGEKLNLSRSFVLRSESGRVRAKRGMDINPGETLIGQCYASKSHTESGHLRMCPICTAITRQPSQPRRFPEFINELVCDPTAKSNYLPGIDGFCVQKTFTLDLLQFEGDWEKNSALSAEAGHDVYTEKWEAYTQTIKRHCACELLPSSPIASYL